MCGLIGVYINKMNISVMKNLYDLFVRQQHRGTDGAGISINSDNKIFRFRSHSPYRVFNVYNINLWKGVNDGDRILFHHRLPSSTENKPRYNHPIADEYDVLHVIHNGVISNSHELHKDLKTEHTFETTDKKNNITDSEVIVHILQEELKKRDSVVKALSKTYDKLKGSFAIALQMKGDKNIYLLRQERPLIISKDTKGNYYFSSEFKSINNLKFVCEMKEGEIGKLSKSGYKRLLKKKIRYVQDTMASYTYFGYGGVEKKTEDNYDYTSALTPELIEYVLSVKERILEIRPNIDFGKLCLKIYNAVDDYDPSVNIEDEEIRDGIRMLVEEGKIC